ncbi:S41 family peptidase [Tenacibaculum sp. ZS6-P6]|uniref:S41 family peptidase n=1 Tax=Tenacibaculum sp. ZS6-P6 TaxID=3447503 RepID=UPI003F9B6A31
MRNLLTLSLLLLTHLSFAQKQCKCSKDLDFVITYYENNLPGFKDNVTSKTKATYTSLKTNLIEEANKVSTKNDCYKLTLQYVEFFRDNHSSIYMRSQNIDENNEEELQQFLTSETYTSRETIPLEKVDQKQYPIDNILGIYEIKNAYTVAVIPSKTKLRDYVGVILDAKTKLWKKGQVKFELKKTASPNEFLAISYLKNHAIKYESRFSLKEGVLGDYWFKTSLNSYVNHAIDVPSTYDFKIINDSISYLRIPTFSGKRTAKIDSLYKASFNKIKKQPYLIIDVRNNGGGSDDNVNPLLEFMYTNKIKTDKVDLYITKDNIKIWESWYEDAKSDTVNFDKDRVKWFKKRVERMKEAKLDSYISVSKGGRMSRNFKPNAVKKVAIIYNKNCASSCETLLFWAKQSKKTILVGENSGGYVGYGEVGAVTTPCYNFTLTCTSSRYKKQRTYEVIGIAPNFYLNNQKSWVDQTIELLKE